MMPATKMIVDELIKLGYKPSEAGDLIWTHMAPILANLIHIAEMDRRRAQELKVTHAAQFSSTDKVEFSDSNVDLSTLMRLPNDSP